MTVLTVADRIITSDRGWAVSGQSYTVQVVLDSMWDGLDASVRMVYGSQYRDFLVSGGSCTVEYPSSECSEVEFGVIAGRLSTTNRARTILLPSILDATRGSSEADPTEAWA